MKRYFEDEGFEFARLNLLGATYRGLSDVGEVLVTLDRIPDGDREAWVREFTALAERLEEQAHASAVARHPISARSAYLRASTYYDEASSGAIGTSEPERFSTLWQRHRGCWDAAAVRFEPPVERVAIPYEGTRLEGYFFRPKHGGERPRPTLILNNGSDGPVTSMWKDGGAAAVERGWNALAFDGPGQGAALHRQKLSFRPDWERVITPVVDWLLTWPDVDPRRIVLQGVSQAGYMVPRAVAFEHRIAAAVVDPGVMRVGDSWTAHLPQEMRQLLDANEREAFDGFMEVGLKESPSEQAGLRWRMAPYGTQSPFEAFKAAEAMHLDAELLARIECPMLITSPDHEQFWPGQSEELHAALGSSTLSRFTEDEGASGHCEPAAMALRDERVFDWLERTLHAGSA
ncbi:alpha/beta hydrolase family protein [Corallococcus terminator]|uniref:Alpha/beta hydrolase n=1 Tax=Corallococcus terminator TaxID=2316733 RepID=A0A3A8J4B8_9BACT|nr:alpha/beta hydrolase [Corallococcus terminator]RKG84383.1 alpha/beta hydrolase [Corallococcus terminator]